MPTPFPGMDPYLEHPALWKEVHTGLSVAIADALGPQIRPRYRVSVERRTYFMILTPDDYELVSKPKVPIVLPPWQASGAVPVHTSVGVMPRVADLPKPVEVIERYLEIRDVVTGDAITTIEILSPANKSSSTGREKYERKRNEVLGSTTNLVEIDLLRAGEPFPFYLTGENARSDYRIIVSRAQHRPRSDIYLFNLRDPIPEIPFPLQPGEVEPVLPLNKILHELYDRAGYDLAVDYKKAPGPPLSDEAVRWVRSTVATIYPKQKMPNP